MQPDIWNQRHGPELGASSDDLRRSPSCPGAAGHDGPPSQAGTGTPPGPADTCHPGWPTPPLAVLAPFGLPVIPHGASGNATVRADVQIGSACAHTDRPYH